jgi:hypothetical protein
VLPKQIGEASAVAVTGGVNPLFIDFVFGFERGEHGVEEFEISVLLVAGRFLPAGSFAFGVCELSWGVESLHVDADGFGPFGVEMKLSGSVAHVAAVSVETEDDRGGRGGCRRRDCDEGFTWDAVDGPLAKRRLGSDGQEESEEE